jgi:hypothetical protein
VSAGSQECVRFSRGDTPNANSFWAFTSWNDEGGPIIYVQADGKDDVPGAFASKGNGILYLLGGQYVTLSNRDVAGGNDAVTFAVDRSDYSNTAIYATAGTPTSEFYAYNVDTDAYVNMTTGGNWSFADNVAITSSLGVGTTGSGVSGEIRATGTITQNFSDDRLKNRFANIGDAVAKINTLNGFYYEPNELAQSLGYQRITEVGLSAQEVEAILPEVVVPAPIDAQYKTIHYERLIPLLVEAIKELAGERKQDKAQIIHLNERLNKLERMLGIH